MSSNEGSPPALLPVHREGTGACIPHSGGNSGCNHNKSFNSHLILTSWREKTKLPIKGSVTEVLDVHGLPTTSNPSPILMTCNLKIPQGKFSPSLSVLFQISMKKGQTCFNIYIYVHIYIFIYLNIYFIYLYVYIFVYLYITYL